MKNEKSHIYTDKHSNTLKWRDLTGPEKLKLLKNINMVSYFQVYQMLTKFKKYGHNYYIAVIVCEKFDHCSLSFKLKDCSNEESTLASSSFERSNCGTPYFVG